MIRMHRERLPGRVFFKSPSFARQATELDAWEQVDDLKRRIDRDLAIYAKADQKDLDDDDLKAVKRLRTAMCRQLDLPI
jgi:hypothetical protein